MAITEAQIALIPDYTYAQILRMTKYAIITLTGGGQSASIGGKTVVRANLKDLIASLPTLEILASSEVGNGGMAIVIVGDPV